VQEIHRQRLEKQLASKTNVSEMPLSAIYSLISSENGNGTTAHLFEPNKKCGDATNVKRLECELKMDEPYSTFVNMVVDHPGLQSSLRYTDLCEGLLSYRDKLKKTIALGSESHPLRKNVAWGWKLGKSVMMVREWEAIWPGEVKMIHVIRDGRDVSFGHVRHTTVQICRHFFETTALHDRQANMNRTERMMNSRSGVCGAAHTTLRSWGAANLAFREIGKKVLGDDRFMTLRIEDIALAENPRPTIRKILRFLGTINDAMTPEENEHVGELVEQAVKFVGNHSSTYGGNKLSAATKRQRLAKLGLTRQWTPAGGGGVLSTQSAFDHFGYNHGKWGLAEEQWSAMKG
jgi:hypothetical protein